MTDAAPRSSFCFEALLVPHRSLSQRGFWILLGCVSVISFVAGTYFALHGAWPIFGFFGLDIALLYVAFRLSYRSGRWSERISLQEDCLTVTRTSPSGQVVTWTFQPYWVRVGAPDPDRGIDDLTLSSHGRSIAIGRFLSPAERQDTAMALCEALRRYRENLSPA